MRRLISVSLAVLALSGCATWRSHGVAVRPPRKLRLAVLPVGRDLVVRRLSHIKTIPKGLDLRNLPKAEQKRLVQEEMAANRAWLRRKIEERFSRSYAYEVIADSDVLSALAREGLASGTDLWGLKPAKFKSLAKRLGADVLLKTRLDGYGKVKGSWLALILGTDYIQYSVTGAIVATATGNPWNGIVVGGTGALVDTVNWTLAFWFFNRIFVPVLLRTDLVSGYDGRNLASKTELEISVELFVHDKALDQYPKEQRKLKQIRLKAVAEEAVNDIGAYFEGRAFGNEGVSAKRKLPFL